MAKSDDRAGTQGIPAGWVWISILGIYLLALSTVTIYLAVRLWPDCVNGVCDEIVFGFEPWALKTTDIDQDERLFWTAVIFGAIGSYIHVAASFSDYVGNRRLMVSWLWWFVLRTPIGIALAVVFYVAIRAGFLTGNSGDASTNVVNPFGIAAISAMAGMFSTQAADKLNEVFTTLFRTSGDQGRSDKLTGVFQTLFETSGDQERGDKLMPAAPKIELITPPQLRSADATHDLAIKGSGFNTLAKVKANDEEFAPTAVTATDIKVALSGLTLKAGATVNVVVKNPPDAGGESQVVALTVT